MAVTWMIVLNKDFMIPFDRENQSALEDAVNIGKIYLEVRDSHFAGYGTVSIDLGGDVAWVGREKCYRIKRMTSVM